jgi:hypothetical protein
LKIARAFVYHASARGDSLPSPLGIAPGSQPQQNRENRTMRISEKAIALLLAVVISGAAFQTFIV